MSHSSLSQPHNFSIEGKELSMLDKPQILKILYIITNMVCVYLSVRLLLIFYLFPFL
jgi:hypothetical protein